MTDNNQSNNDVSATCPYCSALSCNMQYRYDFEIEQFRHAMINGDANLTFRTDHPACHIRPDWCPRFMGFVGNLRGQR